MLDDALPRREAGKLEVVGAQSGPSGVARIALEDQEAELLPRAVPRHAVAADHEAVVRIARVDAVAVLVAVYEDQVLEAAAGHRPRGLVDFGGGHARPAPEVLQVPVPQDHRGVDRAGARQPAAEGLDVGGQQLLPVGAGEAEEGRVPDLVAEDEVRLDGDVALGRRHGEVVGRLEGEAREGVLAVHLHEAVAKLVDGGLAGGPSSDPEVVVARHGEQRLGLGLQGHGLEEGLGYVAARLVALVEVVPEDAPKVYLV
mmetsp:Transcript_65421/g.202680  ORF Transcript_65421/g.202680 Transcript_65421/m.202680 type:complete len:257 (+) Transcript_65421:577-1347(+)